MAKRIWNNFPRQDVTTVPRGHVRQVYAWIMTGDEKIILVSKNGSEWQFPGGKPDGKESWQQTAVREILEETGLDISPFSNSLELFGYYAVSGDDNFPRDYLQLRCFLRIDILSEDLNLHPGNEAKDQTESDAIRFTKASILDEALRIIPWLSDSEELESLRSGGFIS